MFLKKSKQKNQKSKYSYFQESQKTEIQFFIQSPFKQGKILENFFNFEKFMKNCYFFSFTIFFLLLYKTPHTYHKKLNFTLKNALISPSFENHGWKCTKIGQKSKNSISGILSYPNKLDLSFRAKSKICRQFSGLFHVDLLKFFLYEKKFLDVF